MVERQTQFVLVGNDLSQDVTPRAPSEDPYHLWLDGTHYVSVGEVDEVAVDDIFLRLGPENPTVRKITERDVEEPDPSTDYEEIVETKGWGPNGWARTQKFPVQRFTGLESAAMGYAGPPEKLEPAIE
jgi:hypothetical protein